MTPRWLRRLRVSYASVTPETRAVTRVTPKRHARVYVRAYSSCVSVSVGVAEFVAANQKVRRNRVTHVTARYCRVTHGVTHVTTGLRRMLWC